MVVLAPMLGARKRPDKRLPTSSTTLAKKCKLLIFGWNFFEVGLSEAYSEALIRGLFRLRMIAI
ncbi:hypothetical protein D9M71_814120 [compost metagenome]